jgi:1-aminocyclopropane-1-carboxylate deaminase
MTFLSPLVELHHPLFSHFNVKVSIKRDDLIHPVISGNKWRKLKHNILAAKSTSKAGIISFGGAYSNHIHALAYACKLEGLRSIGIIRGEPHYANNATLSQAASFGMTFDFVSRKEYRERAEKVYLQQLQEKHPNLLIVPEGGSNQLALQGVSEIVTELKQQTNWDYLITPVGSGGTIAGLLSAAHQEHEIIGISVLKQAGYLEKEVVNLLAANKVKMENWQVVNQYHCGGYAKFSNNDQQQIISLAKQLGIPLEPIYSGKMILAFFDMLKNNYFRRNSHIVLLHTGGLQGLKGLAEQNKIKASEWPWLPALQAQ